MGRGTRTQANAVSIRVDRNGVAYSDTPKHRASLVEEAGAGLDRDDLINALSELTGYDPELHTLNGLPLYLDRDGNAISLPRFTQLQGDPEYCQVDLDIVGERYRISTIWTGANTTASAEPEIFETMVFDDKRASGVAKYQLRTSTYEDACADHDRMVKLYTDLGGAQ